MAQAAKKSSQKHEIHPAAELFPMMSEAEFAGLKADIELHGQREDIIAWCGKIIDGRHRLRACTELGIEPSIADLDEHHDPIAYVISHNLHRRHLTTSQRAMVAANVAKLKHGDVKTQKSDGSIDLSTQQEAASLLNVSVPSVKRAKKVKDKGTPELAEMVSSGKVSVDAASKVATKPKAEQEAIVAKGPAAIKEAAACVPKKVSKGAGVPKVSVELKENPHAANTNMEYARMAILLMEKIDFSQEGWSDAIVVMQAWIDGKRGAK